MRLFITESIINDEVEGVTVAIVSEPVVRSREFLKTLQSYGGEVSCEVTVFCYDQRATSNETVNQRLLSHRISMIKTLCNKFFFLQKIRNDEEI